MAKVIRLRSAPHLINLGSGVSYGSSGFFGQTANNLTNTLRELQDIENLKKFAEGDPGGYLDYWKTRQRTAKGPLYDKMALYAEQAKKHLVTQEADSKALTEYARTNNHQKYMSYLLEKLNTETDPSMAAKLASQIDTLRSRVFQAGAGGSLAGGVSTGELTDARIAYQSAVQKAKSLIDSRGGISQADPSAPMDIKRLKEAADNLKSLNDKIMNDTGAPAKARLDASSENTSGNDATQNVVATIQRMSDIRQLSDGGFDAKGNTAFNTKVTNLTDPAAKAKAYAERAQKAAALANGMQTEDLKKDLVDASGTYQTEAVKNILTVDQVATKMPAEVDAKIQSAYTEYKDMMAKTGNAAYDVGYPTFKKELAATDSPSTFMKNLKIPTKSQKLPDGSEFINADEMATLKEYLAAGNPAKYDPSTNTWKGDDQKVASAKVAAEAGRIVLGIKDNIYAQYNPRDPSTMTPDIQTDLFYGVNSGRLPTTADQQAGLAQQRTGERSRIPSKDVNQVADTAANAAPAPALGATEAKPTDALPPATPTPEPTSPDVAAPKSDQLGTQSVVPGSQQDFEQTLAGIDTFLTKKDYPELPDWTPPESSQADMNSSFPYSLPSGPSPEDVKAQRGAIGEQAMPIRSGSAY